MSFHCVAEKTWFGDTQRAWYNDANRVSLPITMMQTEYHCQLWYALRKGAACTSLHLTLPATRASKMQQPIGQGCSLALLSPGFTVRMTFAGLPATTDHSGTSRVTTAPAPIIQPSPIVTPPVKAQQSSNVQSASVSESFQTPSCGTLVVFWTLTHESKNSGLLRKHFDVSSSLQAYLG